METWIKIHQKFKRRIGDHCIGVVKCESKNSDIVYSQYPVTFVLCSVWIHDRLFRKGNIKGFHYPYMLSGVWGNTIGWGTALQAVGPNGVIGSLFLQNTSGCTMALWLTQSLTEMNPRDISWRVKAVGAEGWQPYPFMCWLEIWEPHPPGTLRARTGISLLYIRHHTMKYGEWSYRVVHLYHWHWVEESFQLHSKAILPSGTEPSLAIKQEAGLAAAVV
jgi:hypothetical protein